MYLCIHIFSIYTYSLLDLAQQFPGLTAAPSCLIKGDLFLQRIGLVLSLILSFSGSFALHFLVPKPQ